MKRAFGFYVEAYRGLPAAVWLLAAVTLVNRAGTLVLPFMALYLTQSLGYDATFAGFALSGFGLGAFLGNFLGGYLTDRMAPVKVLALSLVSGGLGFLGLEHLRGEAAILAGMLVLGTFSEAYRPASGTAYALFCPPERRIRAYALDRLAINLGMIVGPALGGLLAVRNYAWLFRVDGLTCLAAAAVVFYFFIGKKRKTQAPLRTSGTSVLERSPWRDGPFLVFLLLVCSSGILFFQVFSTYPIFLKNDYGFSEVQYGLLMTLNGFLIITCEMALTQTVSEKPALPVVAWGVGFTGLSFAMLPLGGGFAYAALSMTVLTIGEMLAAPASMVYVANRAGDKRRGSYMGLFNMSYSAAYVISPVLGTFVYQRFGAETLWFGVGVSALLTVVGFYWLYRRW